MITRKVILLSEKNFRSVIFRVVSSCIKPMVMFSAKPFPVRVIRWENPACTVSGLNAVISGADAADTGARPAEKTTTSIQIWNQYLAGNLVIMFITFEFMKILRQLFVRV